MTVTRPTAPADAAAVDRWNLAQDIFLRAVELSPADQAQFVAEACGSDDELRREIHGMLRCDQSPTAHGPLTDALDAAISATTGDRRQALIGTMIGPYRLKSVLGHGGAGSVYLAERADEQYSAQVAIKVVESAALHPDMALRFRAERQILASLNHPNIARLIDGGETDKGVPFLVMDYIQGGQPIDKYCDAHELTLRERLELFLQVCTAVQFAHQNFIVHRDLKPANILVTQDGVPKLLDFGIAKLLDTSPVVTQSVALTRMNDRLLTPEYASPEQILGKPVTTSSDVYALGIVLYELLTGSRPYEVTSSSQLELERAICVIDPPRPSVLINRPPAGHDAVQPSAAELAGKRQLTIEKWRRELSGDLDAIVMRALRKEAALRYGSMEQLSADIQRYLDAEPVEARQGNWAYYSQRFVRRHTVGVSVSIAVALLLVGVAVVTSIQAQRIAVERDRATQESQRAETVSTFMLDVFAAADPMVSQGREVTARELLDQAASKIRGNLNQQPEVRARLMEAMGVAYFRQGQADRAVTFLEDAVRLRRDPAGALVPEASSTLTSLGVAQRDSGDFNAAEKSLIDAQALVTSRGDAHSVAMAENLAEFGRLQFVRGDLASAQNYFQRSVGLYRELVGINDVETAAVQTDLVSVLVWQNDLVAAERLAREATESYRLAVPELHPDRVFAEFSLGEILFRRGRLDEAGDLLQRSLQKFKALYGDYSPRTAAGLDALALTRLAQGRLEESEALAREAVTAAERSQGAEQFMTGYYRTMLGQILLKRQKYAEAEAEVRAALEVFQSTLPADHQYVASAEHFLGEIHLATRRYDDAETTLRAAMNRWKRTGAPEARIARSTSALGEALYRKGNLGEAEKLLADSYAVLRMDGSAGDETDSARRRLEMVYRATGNRAKLEALAADVQRGARDPRALNAPRG